MTHMEKDIIEAYHALKNEDDGWVSLLRLRVYLHGGHLDMVEKIRTGKDLADREKHAMKYLTFRKKSEIDLALEKLFLGDKIHLISEANQKTLTDYDRDAALHIVGDEKHLFRLRL